MSILALMLYLALIGFVYYLIVTYIPMPAPIKTVITVIVAIFLILFLVNVFGGGTILNRPITPIR